MTTDIQTENLLFRHTPPKWHPYIKLMRLDRPIGIWLLLLPGWWSIVLLCGGIAHMPILAWYYMLLFAVGATVMRSAGCIVNDLWDRKLDAAVARTRTRPLASGELTPKQAVRCLSVLLGIGLLILLHFNMFTIMLGILSLALVVAYPAMKRITWWPQLFLGFTFNWGALMACAALTGEILLPAALLYIGGIFWTLAYDTIYAHQDKEDDALIGVKSTARLFGRKSPQIVSLFFGLAFCLFCISAVLIKGSCWALILPGCHLLWQIARWDMDNPQNCLRIFKSNRDFGLLLLLAFSL